MDTNDDCANCPICTLKREFPRNKPTIFKLHFSKSGKSYQFDGPDELANFRIDILSVFAKHKPTTYEQVFKTTDSLGVMIQKKSKWDFDIVIINAEEETDPTEPAP
jgi:hypothetical protein